MKQQGESVKQAKRGGVVSGVNDALRDDNHFSSLFTIISLSLIVLITAAVSVICMVNLRAASYNSIDSGVRERMERLAESTSSRFQIWTTLVQSTALGIAPYMAKRPVDTAAIKQILERAIAVRKDLQQIYCTGNTLWHEPDGFQVIVPDYQPDLTWDNTSRNWFTGAKEKQGGVSIARPYIDVVTGQLITAISTNVYDTDGKDVGVVSANVSIAFLSELLDKHQGVAGEQTFFINKDSLYVTHADEEAVLTRSLFSDFGLEQYRDAVLGSESFAMTDKRYSLYSAYLSDVDRFLVTVIPTPAIYADTNRLIIRLVILNIALLLVAGVVATILIRVLRRDRTEITTINHLLAAERDEIAAMKDNLTTGIFLMDKEGVIQPNYSRSLEKTIAVLGLQKKKFTDLLSASFKPSELSLIKDFFDMVLARVRPQKQLDRLNPLEELAYTSIETREAKTLRCHFMPVERNGDVFILGTVDDITEETQLRKRLEEAGARRQEEMRSFFEVVHMDSSILAAFTEDAAHNLEAGLALLQDVSDPESTSASSDTETVLVSLYQLLHAVKSDAYIVGLSVYGDKLHSTESEIKRLRESDTPPSPDDFAALTSQLERLLDEKDALINILEQLHAPVPAVKQDEVAVLSASLKRACERVAADLGKQARFEPLAIDAEAVKSVPRRQLKEILIQLVRNAVYHGIEAPEQRRAAAKDETGVIQLSIQRRATLVASTAELSHSGELAITIKDDGAGLNFDKIRRKALDQGLIDKDVADDSTENQLLRVLFLPGFSTAETSGAHAGRGIGLNMVRDQVRALSGSIKVRTERGKGTAFVVSLPL